MNPVWHITYSDGKNKLAINKKLAPLSTTGEASIFTTFSSFYDEQKGHIFPLFDRHIERLIEGSKKLKIINNKLDEHRPEIIRKAVLDSCYKYFQRLELPNQSECLKTRLVLSPHGLEVYLTAVESDWFPEKAVSLVTYSGTRPNAGVKHSNNPLSISASEAALAQGANHALLVSKEGLVQECDWANIFWFEEKNTLCGSRLNSLPGIVQQLVARTSEVKWREVTTEHLIDKAHTVFITKGTTGISPVESINQIRLKSQNKLRSSLVQVIMPEFLSSSIALELK